MRERVRKEGGGDEIIIVTSQTYCAGQHAASEPDSIALHVVSNHVYLNWFRLCSVCVCVCVCVCACVIWRKLSNYMHRSSQEIQQ